MRRRGGRVRTLAMWGILLALPALAVVLMVLGYYAYAKLTYPAYACGSFAKPDAEIGWVLAPDASSCLGGKDLSGRTDGYHSEVHIDANGFRAARPGVETALGGILFVGDSWTFGFGVDYGDSFPGRFEALTGWPVTVAASPAYSALQSLLLAERWVDRLKPRAIVYFDRGFWTRAACRGDERPRAILKPCFWQRAPGVEAVAVLLPPGRVEAAARWGNLPGGMIGVGETGWDYFLVSRPLARLNQALVRAGLISGFGDDFHAWGVEEEAIRRATLARIGALAGRAGVPLILLDVHAHYATLIHELPAAQRHLVRYVNAQEWAVHVDAPSRTLPPEQAFVPGDGHYGPGTNDLIARFLTHKFADLGIGR